MIGSEEFPAREVGGIPYVSSSRLAGLDCLQHFFCGRTQVAAREALGAMALPSAPLLMRQVHGDVVIVVDKHNVDGLRASPPEADAIITRMKGIPIAVLTADCVSVVVCDPRTPALGIIHAGWRGTVRSATEKTVQAMIDKFGSRPEDCWAAVGPAVSGPCYEVGEDVREACVRALAYGQDVLEHVSESRWKFDLSEANRRQLISARLPGVQTAVCPFCTHCESGSFHSVRRDGAVAGRQATVAFLR